MPETTAMQSMSEISQEGHAAPSPRSQLLMILWCGGLALSHVAYWLVNAGDRLNSRNAAAVFGALIGMGIPVLGYGFATWRFIQLGRGQLLPNLWGLRLFSALVFVLVVVGGLGMGLLKDKQGMPGDLAIPGLVIACTLVLVLVTPLYILNRRAKSQGFRRRGE